MLRPVYEVQLRRIVISETLALDETDVRVEQARQGGLRGDPHRE